MNRCEKNGHEFVDIFKHFNIGILWCKWCTTDIDKDKFREETIDKILKTNNKEDGKD